MCLRPGGDACVLGVVERAGNALYGARVYVELGSRLAHAQAKGSKPSALTFRYQLEQAGSAVCVKGVSDPRYQTANARSRCLGGHRGRRQRDDFRFPLNHFRCLAGLLRQLRPEVLNRRV
jgi:hypothetical protein